MTRLLNQAITKVQELTPTDQDTIAAIILEELEDEARWAKQFAGSQDALAKLARKARKDIAEGRVQEIGIDEL